MENMNFKSIRQTISLLFVAGVSLLISACAMPVYYPGLTGTILDSKTNEPIEEAHVICIDHYYQLIEIINVGGANFDYSAIYITDTDSNGKFNLPSYFKCTLPSDDLRFIIIYKEGYYSPKYIQTGFSSFEYSPLKGNHIDVSSDYFNPLYLDGPQKTKEGYDVSCANNAQVLLGRVLYFAEDFSWNHPYKFKKYKHVFEAIYKILSEDSENIIHQINKDKHKYYTSEQLVEEWAEDLEELGKLINGDGGDAGDK